MRKTSITSPEDQSVTFVELFFDLVFVFCITQIVGILHHGFTFGAVAQSVLVFWLVWWAWTQFTWALNAADTDHAHVQLLTLAATAVAFFMAVSVPAAFEGAALWFAGPYVMVRSIGLWLYSWAASENEGQLAAVRTFAFVSIGGLAAVLVGAIAGGDQLYYFWGLAILLDVIAANVGGREEGWNLHPGHFSERHGLIVIIALGESLIVAGGGLVSAPQEISLVVVGFLAVTLTCALWWSYFPYIKPALEEAMHGVKGSERAQMARDTFSLAHFPMLCGIIGIAAALEVAIAHSHEALATGPRAALAVGLLLFLGGTAVARWRALRHTSLVRIGVVLVMTATVLLLAGVPSYVSLAVGLAGTMVVVFLEHQEIRISHGAQPEPA
jgi:low temperature requirement protein LtrA